MQGQVSDGPVLLLRTSEQEYATIQEVLAFVPRMDRAIAGYAQPAIDRLAARLPRPFFPAAGKELTLVRGDLACLCSIFAAVWKPPLSERRDIRECLEKLVDLSEQSSRFVDREWMAPPTHHRGEE
jgi:hypothetical protein